MLTLVESNLHGFPIARHGFVAYKSLTRANSGKRTPSSQWPFHVVACHAGCGSKLRRVAVLSALLRRIVQCVSVTGVSDPLVLTLLAHIRVTCESPANGTPPSMFWCFCANIRGNVTSFWCQIGPQFSGADGFSLGTNKWSGVRLQQLCDPSRPPSELKLGKLCVRRRVDAS